jgi:myo-inositol-1(or 4)-monophosphatase
MNIYALIPHLCTAITQVGDYVASQQSQIKSISYKGIKDPQTNIDIEAENLLYTRLKELAPEAGFILEESGEQKKERYNWTIDPIDGTKFFSTTYPQYFTQIALYDGDEVVFSAIYQPVAKQLFHAVRGKGAFLNNIRITLREPTTIQESIVNMELGNIGDDVHKLTVLNSFAKAANRLILLSGILAPYLLTDTTQVYIRYHGKIAPYDTAPRILLFQEAGADVYTGTHKGKEIIIAAHPKLMYEVKQLIFGTI